MSQSKLRVGTFTRSVLIDVARSTGLLDAARLSVEEIAVTSSPAAFSSLERDDLDLVMSSPDNVIAYRFLSNNPLGRMLPVQIHAAIDRGLGLSLCTAPGADWDAVRAGTLAVDVPHSGFALAAYALLERAGLRPGDYDVMSLGSTPQRADALISGTCQATVLNAGNEQRAEAAGCSVVSPVGVLGPYLGTVVVAMPPQDTSALTAQTRFTDVLLDTAQRIVGGAHHDEVVESASRLLALDHRSATAHLDCLLDDERGLIVDGVVDAASVATLVSLRRTYLPTAELDHVADNWHEMISGHVAGDS